MPNINDAFPSNYIKASDLKGAPRVVTIDRIKFEEVGRDKQLKPVVYFRDKDKGLVLNKTNANKITALVGSSDTDNWQGRAICLYPTDVEYAGETMEGIRVKAAPANGGSVRQPEPPPQADDFPPDEDIPF